jgi:gamma-glutamylcyclotransferase (GGCT)/AIG2-like uncharacterized protein YtfP
MNPSTLDTQLIEVLQAINRVRARGGGEHHAAEGLVEARFTSSENLATYGSLAPGEVNHHIVESLAGEWREGFVRGKTWRAGWGTELGYPAMRWMPDGDEVPVKLLISPGLAADWPRLDGFEGGGYLRVLVPVETESGLLTIANIYEAAPDGPS